MGSVGWDSDIRMAVLFFLDGGTAPPRGEGESPISDTALNALADSGVALMFREMRDYLLGDFDDLADDA